MAFLNAYPKRRAFGFGDNGDGNGGDSGSDSGQDAGSGTGSDTGSDDTGVGTGGDWGDSPDTSGWGAGPGGTEVGAEVGTDITGLTEQEQIGLDIATSLGTPTSDLTDEERVALGIATSLGPLGYGLVATQEPTKSIFSRLATTLISTFRAIGQPVMSVATGNYIGLVSQAPNAPQNISQMVSAWGQMFNPTTTAVLSFQKISTEQQAVSVATNIAKSDPEQTMSQIEAKQDYANAFANNDINGMADANRREQDAIANGAVLSINQPLTSDLLRAYNSYKSGGAGAMLNNGTVIQNADNPMTYVIWNGQKRFIATDAVFDALGLKASDINMINGKDVALIPEGAPIYDANQFISEIQSGTSPVSSSSLLAGFPTWGWLVLGGIAVSVFAGKGKKTKSK